MKDNVETKNPQGVLRAGKPTCVCCPECGGRNVYMSGTRTNAFDGLLQVQLTCYTQKAQPGMCGRRFEIALFNTKPSDPFGPDNEVLLRVETSR